MNKKAIWIIIGLMTASVIGLVGLQVHWISWSIKLNEEQFDTNVFGVLGRVAERLEREESSAASQLLDSTFGGTENPTLSEGEEMQEDTTSQYFQATTNKLDRYSRTRQMIDMAMIQELLKPKPLAERIDVERLDLILKQELQKAGIALTYNYGVFARQLNAFVIRDNGYLHVTNKNSTRVVHASSFDHLYNSKYGIDLFTTQDLQSPGLLMVFFPAKSSYVWSTVWMTLLASVLFTGIILFCFAYTINVIFEQKKLSEIKNDFINNMTHEFKTPIATISLATDSIANPIVYNNPDKLKRFANIIRQENKRMNDQVEKVLQMAILDREEMRLNKNSVNLHDVITQAVSNFSLQVEKREGTLNAELNAENPIIEGDLTHISSMIQNLMDNANKYSPEKPEITVSTRNISGGVEVTVTDKGMGMSKEARKHIFDKFYRVHTGNLHDVKGFGLGLSYVKAMMTAHKGTVDVKSELGKGSNFILYFPAKN
ncbi:MAG: hypothetical protein RLZZ292_2846 [Bacteroidota bacterium]|jgi:two-component system phosphate regulon sensor histidine kinase PhoR